MSRRFWINAWQASGRYHWLLFFGGMVAAWLIINLSAGPGVIITSEAEAEGPQFSDVNTLDLVLHAERRRVCPSMTQRWIWRWTTYRGERVQQAMPLSPTDNPFLADSKTLILTLPAAGVPDPVNGQWFFRSVTSEQCSFVPTWAAGLLGARMFRSRDVPVNFVGAPHGVPSGNP